MWKGLFFEDKEDLIAFYKERYIYFLKNTLYGGDGGGAEKRPRSKRGQGSLYLKRCSRQRLSLPQIFHASSTRLFVGFAPIRGGSRCLRAGSEFRSGVRDR